MRSLGSEQVKGYKICAGNGCSSRAKYPPKILYLNKIGWFCGTCKNGLLNGGLVTENESDRTLDYNGKAANRTK
jgi:hypothetical protein